MAKKKKYYIGAKIISVEELMQQEVIYRRTGGEWELVRKGTFGKWQIKTVSNLLENGLLYRAVPEVDLDNVTEENIYEAGRWINQYIGEHRFDDDYEYDCIDIDFLAYVESVLIGCQLWMKKSCIAKKEAINKLVSMQRTLVNGVQMIPLKEVLDNIFNTVL